MNKVIPDDEVIDFTEADRLYEEEQKENQVSCGNNGVNGDENDNRQTEKGYRCLDLQEFLSVNLPPRTNLLSPWLPSQGLTMIHAARGIGKTYVALNIGYCIASGSKFLHWAAPTPKGVLYIDGEMPAIVLQERLKKIKSASKVEIKAPFKILTPDMQCSVMPNIADGTGQSIIKPFLEGVSLVIVDNISTLCRFGAENNNDDWSPVQQWGLRLRMAGLSVLFIHHDGKNGNQRGGSRKEDILDTVIGLKRPLDYTNEQGARFEINFEKNRGIYGEDVKPFEAWLKNDLWEVKNINNVSKLSQVVELLNEGLNQNKIAEKLCISKGQVSKLVTKSKVEGLLK